MYNMRNLTKEANYWIIAISFFTVLIAVLTSCGAIK